MEFLASSVFRAVLVPMLGVIAIALAKWQMSRDDASDDWCEIFAVGPDLVIAAVLAIPAFITEKAAQSTSSMGDDASLASSGWLFLIVFFIAQITFTFERKYAKVRRRGGGLQGWFVGVIVPMLFGASALSLTFELSR